MPAGALPETFGATDGFFEHHRIAAGAFPAQGFILGQIPLLIGRKPVGLQALLREGGDLPGQGDGFIQCRTVGHHPVGQADLQGFIGRHRPAGQNHIHGPAVADQSRQTHGAAVDQGHAPAPAEHAERGGRFRHSQVAQQRQLQAAGHGKAAHGGNHRFA